MSQIRKLQNGGTPKYGVLRIGNTVYDTPEAIDAFEGFLRAGDKSYAPITGKWMDYIRKGHDVSINPIDNTIEISGVSADDYSDLYGATKRQRRILESDKPTFGGNNFSTKFRDAVYYAGGFSGPTKSAENESKKTKVSNGKIKIDYDTIDGVQKYSNNPSNKLIAPQIDAYLAYLGDEKWGETNEWENELGDNDRILKAWYNGFEGDKGTAAKAAIDTALNEVRTKPWNEVSEASRELLAYFNIVGPDGQVNGSSNSSYVDENGQVKKNTQNDKGQWGTYRGTGENGTIKDVLYTTYDVGELPYLINADRLGLFEGLDNSYLNSVLYGGRFYRPDEVSQNIQLQKIMEDVARINNNATNAADLYNQLKGIINYTDYDDSVGNYLNYDSSQHYISNKAIREYLANTPYAAIFDATPAYGIDEGKIYGIYDFGKNGENPYGFRSPYYLVTDKDGNLRLNTNDQFNWSENDLLTAFDFLNRDYGNSTGLVKAKEVINGKTYGRIEITDRVDGGSYHFIVDDEGNVYHVTNNGKLELMDPELSKRVLNGEQIVPSDIDNSKRNVKRLKKYDSNWHPPIYRKEGGKIKELPLKLQGGNRLLTKVNTIEEAIPIDDRTSDVSTRGNNTKSGETYMRDIVSKLRNLRDSGRLYKNGGIIKGQIGIPDIKNPYWKNIINIGTQIPKGPTIPTAPAEVSSPNDPIKEHQQELLRKVVDERTSKMGGNYRNWDGSNYLIQPALSAFRYFSQKWGRDKMYDEQKAALNAGRVNRDSISLSTVPTYSTAHQHLENQLQQQLMNGIKPVSSDLTAYYATKLQQQSGLNKALQELTAQKSNYEQQANVQNQQIKSQEALQNNEIAFENAKMRASINSGLHQLEAAKLGEEQASRDNLLYEIQQKLYQDQQLSNQVSVAKINQKNAETYQALLQNEFADEWATWQTVDQTKYTDFEDYVRQINPTKYNQKRGLLEQRKQELDNNLIINSTKGKMNYPWLYNKSGGYHGPAGYLKGGRINGKTRYTLEPDERIWIDNNKAAHAKSAKLNDAAIKLLLRALK